MDKLMINGFLQEWECFVGCFAHYTPLHALHTFVWGD